MEAKTTVYLYLREPIMGNTNGDAGVSFKDKIKSIPGTVFIGVIVALIMLLLVSVTVITIEYFETRPLTASLSANSSGETNILPFFQIQIRPVLKERCSRPNWLAWIGKTVFDQHCIRLSFNPNTLEQMITRRLPFEETADPFKLLEIFIRHHNGCLILKRQDNELIINESENSKIIKKNGKLVCP